MAVYKQIKPFFICILAGMTLYPASSKLSKHYLPLSRIKSPYTLLSNHLPKQYTVPLTLSGSIAEEIKSVLDTLDIEMVHYSELFDRRKGFQVVITNNAYMTQTRDLLSGILNPVEMTDIILNSILRYQEEETLLQIQNATTIAHSQKTRNGIPLTQYTLTPKGKHFCYQYKDMGAYVHESWLTELHIAIDPKTMLAHELSVIKHTRSISTDQQDRPVPKVSTHSYVFSYTTIENILLPSQLNFYVDSMLVLALSASYSKQEQYILFDKREITYFLPDKSTSHLKIRYNAYQFTISSKTQKTAPSGKYSKKLKRAAKLSRKAIEALNNGRIQTAMNILQTIIDTCPGTPQAVEAQKLLTGLPNGL